MKVVHEIIDYLLFNNFISIQDVEILEKKGFYSKPRYYEDKYDYKRRIDEELWKEYNNKENIQEEEFVALEKKFSERDRRRLRQTRQGGKTKRRIRSDQKKGDINLFTKDTELWWQPPVRIRITNKICSRIPELKIYKERVFTNIATFWDCLFRVSAPRVGLTHSGNIAQTLKRHKKGGIRAEWHKKFIDNSMIIMEILNEKDYKLKPRKYIHPIAYCNLIESEKFESDGWSIFLKINRNKSIRVTNMDGAFTLKKLKR